MVNQNTTQGTWHDDVAVNSVEVGNRIEYTVVYYTHKNARWTLVQILCMPWLLRNTSSSRHHTHCCFVDWLLLLLIVTRDVVFVTYYDLQVISARVRSPALSRNHRFRFSVFTAIIIRNIFIIIICYFIMTWFMAGVLKKHLSSRWIDRSVVVLDFCHLYTLLIHYTTMQSMVGGFPIVLTPPTVNA
jgi:hypothetical protein